MCFTTHVSCQWVLDSAKFVLPEPAYFEYSIDCSTSDLADKTYPGAPQTYEFTEDGKDTGETCSRVLTTAYLNQYILTAEIYVNPNIPNKKGGRTLPVVLRTENATQSLVRVKDCCGASKQCQGCFEHKTRCVTRVWNPDDSKHRMYWKGLCNLCLQIECNNICQNGQFAESFTSRDGSNNLMDSIPVCKSCGNGSFNTCLEKPSCSWYHICSCRTHGMCFGFSCLFSLQDYPHERI